MEVARKKVTFEYFKAVMDFMESRFPGQMEMLETTREGPDTKFEARLQQYRLKNKTRGQRRQKPRHQQWPTLGVAFGCLLQRLRRKRCHRHTIHAKSLRRMM